MRHGLFPSIIVLIAASALSDEIRKPSGWIGVGYSFQKSSEAGKPAWLHVQQVAPDGPAYAADVRAQDIITAIDGRPIAFADKAQALAFFAGLTPGRTLRFTIVRRDKKFVIRVKAVPMPPQYQKKWEQNMELLKRSKQP